MTDQLDRLQRCLADRYAVECEIGSGGMATVYLAEDRKHHRKVAIKVLRPDLAAALGPERFLREIEIAAQLQHPNILPLLDSGEAGDFLYYVMPFVEGPSLRDRVATGGELPIADVVRIVRDVVDALTDAHAHGVVHRDIKPENVLLRGRHALITDFGVAKAVSEATGREQLTTAGIALGTPAYMAPEQATADPHLDHRVDIYAVGAVAYELLTGRPVFMGTTPQMVLAAHVTERPQPVSRHRDAVPAALEAVVMRCLEKRPADRWQSAEDLLPHLEALATPSGGMTPATATPVSVAWGLGRRGVLLAAGVAIVVTVAIAFGWWTSRPALPAVTVASIRPVTRAPELELYPAIAPNGGEVAYAAGSAPELHLFIQDVRGGRALPLTAGRPGLQIPAGWTADGRSVVFSDAGGDAVTGLYQISRLGGPVQQLMTGGSIMELHAYTAGTVALVRGDSLLRRDLNGDQPVFVARIAANAHSFVPSPDGSLLAFVAGNRDFILPGTWGNVAPSTIWSVRIEGGTPVQVTTDTSLNVSPVWTPDGRQLLFISNRDGPRGLYAIRLDGAGRPRGRPLRVEAGLDAHSLSLSADGRTLAYSRLTFRRNIVRIAVPRTGSVSIREAEPVTVGNQIVENHDVSEDGRWLAYDSDLEGNQDIYLMPLGGGEPRRLTTSPADDYAPDFSPDGREIAFYSNRYGSRDIFVMSVNGGTPTRLTDDPAHEYFPSFSHDGLHIVYGLFGDARGVYIVSRDSAGGVWSAPRLISGQGQEAEWAPDGGTIVISSRLPPQIWLADVGGEVPVSVDPGPVAGAWATWSSDGSRIRFMALRGTVATGVYETTPTGGATRQLVRFDDPALLPEFALSTGPGDVLYLSVGEFESDIYVAELDVR
jgi:Tol biopolymer transport system component/tRNA A-37 threonylcarbamoyl transferase component Bud32